MIAPVDPNWVAPRDGHDWIDQDILLATNWLKSFVDRREWDRRITTVRSTLLERWQARIAGESVGLFDPADTIAWLVFQAEAYATDRRHWAPEGAALIAPIMTRLGQELPMLMTVGGIDERAERLMTSERRQPDGGLYELLVALAYRRRGWTDVNFIPERRGQGKTPDLLVARPRKRWVAECKRLMTSPFAAREKARSDFLAAPVHRIALENGRSIVLEVTFHVPSSELEDDHLERRFAEFIANPACTTWTSGQSTGEIRDIDWRLARGVLARDFVYYGASRMIELLVGDYDHDADHSMLARWRPWAERPFWADAVYQASVVSCWNESRLSVQQRSKHFQGMLAKADTQLGTDLPGVVHVGVESWSGSVVDQVRHFRNMVEARTFEPRHSRLRWAYANYMAPELTTRHDESWAVNETTAFYRIGNHRTPQPLPHHLLLGPEGGQRRGEHWDGQSA